MARLAHEAWPIPDRGLAHLLQETLRSAARSRRALAAPQGRSGRHPALRQTGADGQREGLGEFPEACAVLSPALPWLDYARGETGDACAAAARSRLAPGAKPETRA